MSSYYKETKHPKTGKWELALWADDALGAHHYGVKFPSEPTKFYDPDKAELETRESAQGNERQVPDARRSSVTHTLSYEIKCTSASHEEPHVCKNRVVEAEVTIELPSGAVTIKKLNAPSNRYGNNNGATYTFIGSDPELARAIGEILIAAADLSKEVREQ